MQIGYIGLGKMGANMAERLIEKRHQVWVYDENGEAVKTLAVKGAYPTYSIEELMEALQAPRIIWLMVPHEAVDSVLGHLAPYLTAGDTIIDGGNSFYKDSIRRARELSAKDYNFLDAGVSGGPQGARTGASVMVGGKKELFSKLEGLWIDISADGGYGYMGEAGAGHFVKMVHNGIEYGMMQALAEGFAVLEKSPLHLHLEEIADLYNHKSVIESRLVGWLKDAFVEFGEDLKLVSGSARQTGEGAWTVEAAKELGVAAPVIERAVEFRRASGENPSYTGKILSALRNKFGQHDVRH